MRTSRRALSVFFNCRPLPLPPPLSGLRTMVDTAPTRLRAGVGRDRRREAIFFEGDWGRETRPRGELCFRALSLALFTTQKGLFHLYIIRGGKRECTHAQQNAGPTRRGERAAVPATPLAHTTPFPCVSTRYHVKKKTPRHTHWAHVLLLFTHVQ